MSDYAEMRTALRVVSERARTLEGVTCPKACCFGTFRRRDGRFLCTDCTNSPIG